MGRRERGWEGEVNREMITMHIIAIAGHVQSARKKRENIRCEWLENANAAWLKRFINFAIVLQIKLR